MNADERELPEASFRPLNNHLFQEPQPRALPWNSPETASPGWTPQSTMEEASPLASKAGPGSPDWAHPGLLISSWHTASGDSPAREFSICSCEESTTKSLVPSDLLVLMKRMLMKSRIKAVSQRPNNADRALQQLGRQRGEGKAID